MIGEIDFMPVTIQERFEKFHQTNPQVYNLFVKYAFEAKRSGLKRYGAKSIFERVRWHIDTQSKKDSGFKINNSFVSRYARKLMDEYPNLRDFFEVRVLKSE